MKQRREQFDVRLADRRRSEEWSLTGGRDFRIDFQAIADELRLPISPLLRDLLRIASSVYAIDRLVKRDRLHGPESWPRHLECEIEVRAPEFWSGSPVYDLLVDALQFVSGDRWRLSFGNDRSPSPARDGRLFESIHLYGAPPVIGLYSGGLDSASGLARQLSSGIAHPLIPVVVRHRNDVARTALRQVAALSDHFDTRLDPVSAVVSTRRPKKLVGREEVSQRARSFLFVAVGGTVAGATDASEIQLYESGIGAVNVPLLAGMEGSQATRSAHPRFLDLMSQLLSVVLERRVDVTLPFVASTKGEIAASLAAMPLREVAASTVSCAHFPIRNQKGRTWKSCGLCPACVFRRLSLHAAGVPEPDGKYLVDILDPQSNHVIPQKLKYLMAYLLQVDSLNVLDTGSLPPLLLRHLRSTGLLQPDASCQPYLELYLRYRTEWHSLIRHARNSGCDWAFRVELPPQAA